MYIKRITINNFKIYKGTAILDLSLDPEKNVTIICGDNGYGKTTLITAILWCLYGSQMQEVDYTCKESILAAGGYKRYLRHTLNRLAAAEGNNKFWVNIELGDVELPGIKCDTIELRRTFDTNNGDAHLEINMDGSKNELVDEIGEEIFVQDFILPKEIAKFFFFDSEKIVSIAEIQSAQEKRFLSQAYTEVLGIKKYLNLRNHLQDMRIRFRKESASDIDKTQFIEFGKEITRLQKSKESKELRKEKCMLERSNLEIRANEIQEKLIREGSGLTPDDIRKIKAEKTRLLDKEKEIKNEFKELLELAPLAINGKLLREIENQFEQERKATNSVVDKKELNNRIKQIMNELIVDDEGMKIKEPLILRQYLISKVSDLLEHHLINHNHSDTNIKILHDFNRDQSYSFAELMANLRTTYRGRLLAISSSLKINKCELGNISKKLANAESKENDSLIQSYREEKNQIDKSIHETQNELVDIGIAIGSLEKEIVSKQLIYNALAGKIKVNEQYVDKDLLAERLIGELDEFIQAMKLRKKASLEGRILNDLNSLMHKHGFISRVNIVFDENNLDVELFDIDGTEIRKDDLSKGEKQLYATAVLKSLVEESDIDFPVFIDSPLQKLDDRHANTIIKYFYPNISKQVVLLALLNKELNKAEYESLSQKISASYIINNTHEGWSEFIQVPHDDLFNEYKRLIHRKEHVKLH